MSNIKLFESKQVRSAWNEEEQKWYFSVQDVVEVLTDSTDVKQYIKRVLSRDEQLKNNWGTICTLVEMKAADGKNRKIQAANTENILPSYSINSIAKSRTFQAMVGTSRCRTNCRDRKS